MLYRQQMDDRNTNQKLVPQAAQTLEQMKYEIANSFGVGLGPNTPSRQNGSVGGEMTKRLIQYAEQALSSSYMH